MTTADDAATWDPPAGSVDRITAMVAAGAAPLSEAERRLLMALLHLASEDLTAHETAIREARRLAGLDIEAARDAWRRLAGLRWLVRSEGGGRWRVCPWTR